MSDPIKHECGVAFVRLLKPLSYYYEKYNSPLWGLFKLYLLMEKQHNRGQDGAGVAAVKLNTSPGYPYIFREREMKRNSLDRIFKKLFGQYDAMVKAGTVHPEFAQTVKDNFDYGAEIYLGHLRYGTSGGYNISACHPYFRRSNWPTKNLVLAGNFNITNNEELNKRLVNHGQHPIFSTDTQTLLEEIGFYLDQEHDAIYRKLRDQGLEGTDIAQGISDQLNLVDIIKNASRPWDGGYSLIGAVGNGDAFALRDPVGIRPLFYFANDEVVAFASERAPLMTVFDQEFKDIQEAKPGHVYVIKKTGEFSIGEYHEPAPQKSCSFERIYFSRGNDQEIYRERKRLGALLSEQILQEINHDFDHSVFSFIPNTAEIGYYGLLESLRLRRRLEVRDDILKASRQGTLTEDFLDSLILRGWPRTDKVANKDIKLRTFISQESDRNQLASHVYDITYGTLNPDDTLVCVDDSIVRGTTLKNSVIKILARLNPKKILIASTSPQIRYPDCYGIDMSELGKFIAFQAVVALLKDTGQTELLQEVYRDCVAQSGKPDVQLQNHVKRIYDRFTTQQISEKISQLVTPKLENWHGEVKLVFQTVENLHKALPNHSGDWYFTGKYPTPGGYKVLNRAYINYYENSSGKRSY
ncbi:MAG: amidophosphoribosyltransferase [Verrucomicrobiales bacterium]|jgi:amidophosphoribosyltransferase|nr:amidophosphoribosyltransferase [Verrucomicrobiales bacterium]